jgi:hypothetical protein
MADLLEALQQALAHRYRIERELGRGGFATVFLATDLKHQREVALKVLHPELALALGSLVILRLASDPAVWPPPTTRRIVARGIETGGGSSARTPRTSTSGTSRPSSHRSRTRCDRHGHGAPRHRSAPRAPRRGQNLTEPRAYTQHLLRDLRLL